MPRDEIAARAFVVERRIDGRLRPCGRNVREDALGAAALIEVIVDESDLQCSPFVGRGKISATVYLSRYSLTTRCTSTGVTASIAFKTALG